MPRTTVIHSQERGLAGPGGPAGSTGANGLPGPPGDSSEIFSALLDGFTTIAPWTASNSGVLTQVIHSVDHPYTMRIATPPGSPGTYTDVRRSFTSFSLTDRFLSFWVRPLDDNLLRISLGLSVNGGDFTNRFESDVFYGGPLWTGRWTRVTVPLSGLNRYDPTGTTDAMLADVRTVRLEVFPQGGTIASVLISGLRMHENMIEPGLIWSFDDGRADTFTVAYPILDARGIRGAIAVETDAVGTAGRCTLAQLQTMAVDGWEMNAHRTGLNLVDVAVARSQLVGSRDWLLTNGFVQGANYYVYPGGAWNKVILDETLKQYRTARLAGMQRIVTPIVEDYGLIKPYYFTTGVSLATAKSAMDKILARGGIMYLSFHTITASPSATEDWPTSDFTALADYAVTLGLTSYVPSEVWP